MSGDIGAGRGYLRYRYAGVLPFRRPLRCGRYGGRALRRSQAMRYHE